MSVDNLKSRGAQPRWKILFVLAALLAASLACNLPGGANRPPDATPIPVTTQSVEELQDNLDAAATQASTTGQINMVFDEAQLTSLVAFELQKQKDPPLREPQVLLRDGQVQIYGKTVQGGVTIPVSIFMTVDVNGRGMPEYKIVSANAGPLPIPQSILNGLTAQLDEAINRQLNPEASNMVIEDITIADGKMTITGHTL